MSEVVQNMSEYYLYLKRSLALERCNAITMAGWYQ